jgi:hypothetical protein
MPRLGCWPYALSHHEEDAITIQILLLYIGSVCSLNNPAHNARKAYESSTSMLIYTPISFFLIIFNIYLNIKIFQSQLILTKKKHIKFMKV